MESIEISFDRILRRSIWDLIHDLIAINPNGRSDEIDNKIKNRFNQIVDYFNDYMVNDPEHQVDINDLKEVKTLEPPTCMRLTFNSTRRIALIGYEYNKSYMYLHFPLTTHDFIDFREVFDPSS